MLINLTKYEQDMIYRSTMDKIEQLFIENKASPYVTGKYSSNFGYRFRELVKLANKTRIIF